MMLDTLEAHRQAFPDPPVSRPKGAAPVAPLSDRKAPAPAVNPQQLLTMTRLSAIGGLGPLAPSEVGAIWARAGVHAEDPAAILRYYHTTGVVVRIRDGRTGPGHLSPLYVVAGSPVRPVGGGRDK